MKNGIPPNRIILGGFSQVSRAEAEQTEGWVPSSSSKDTPQRECP